MKTTKEIEITSFASACRYFKIDPKKGPKITGVPEKEKTQMLAVYWRDLFIKLINKKFNGGKIFKPTFKAGNQQSKRWIWWLWKEAEKGKKAGFRFDGTNGDWANTFTDVGPRLLFVNYDAAAFFGKKRYFESLYNTSVAL
jgi:hypothetical protein